MTRVGTPPLTSPDLPDDVSPAEMLSEDTQFVLANAVLFRGAWLMEFDEAATAPGVCSNASWKAKP